LREDTIAAISTPLGEGGIGIIRVSGPEALQITSRIFKAKRGIKSFESHKMVYGYIFDQYGQMVDEVLFCYMKAPHTYTREEVVEINCHGGMVPLRRILELVLAEGARLAEPGEFSKRAFLNGRLDLAQAESVIDIIRSKTETGLRLAVSQLRGSLSLKVKSLQDKLLGVLAGVEASIDFPDEDIENVADVVPSCEELIDELNKLIAGSEAGIIYREGIRATITGKPNVGKSSLLNALLRENRAIVTSVPGTTRDVIEEVINIKGIPLRIIDTAGLRKTEDLVERIGVERSKEAIEKADLILLVLDDSAGVTGEDIEIIELLRKKRTIVLINKVDVGKKLISQEVIGNLIGSWPVLWISAENGTGLVELEETIADMVLGGKIVSQDNLLITNIRHKRALEKAVFHLREAVAGVKNMIPLDIVAIDIRAAWENLGEITGLTVDEDLIDRIFSEFCIGK